MLVVMVVEEEEEGEEGASKLVLCLESKFVFAFPLLLPALWWSPLVILSLSSSFHLYHARGWNGQRISANNVKLY